MEKRNFGADPKASFSDVEAEVDDIVVASKSTETAMDRVNLMAAMDRSKTADEEKNAENKRKIEELRKALAEQAESEDDLRKVA